jgi:seryl-tRNA synthetase
MEIKLANKKLRDLLTEKDVLVRAGRKISGAIEILERKLEKQKDIQRKYTEECNPTELIEKGNALQDKLNEGIAELEKIGEEIQAIKIAAIPAQHVAEYERLKTEKEEKERDRNKIFLKVQKIKDRSIPIIQKEVKPLLKDYEDINTADLKGDVVVVTTFSHLEDWQEKFWAKNPNPEEA